MSRHARTRSTVRSARHVACGTADSRRSRARNPRCAPQDAPALTLLGIITCEADFEALRRDGGTEYPVFADYLRDMERLLGSLCEAGGVVRGRAFHPADLVEYCELRGLSLADPQSHTAYIADPDADGEWVRHRGEPLPEFLRRLARARERGVVQRRLERMLAETAEAAATGCFPEELLHPAYQRGAGALRGMLAAAGPGSFRIVCGLRPAEGPVEAWAELRLEPGAVLRIEDGDLDLLCSLLCTGYALGPVGNVLLSGQCAERGQLAWGWDFDGSGFTPRNAADVLLDLSAGAAEWIAAGPSGTWPSAADDTALGEIALG